MLTYREIRQKVHVQTLFKQQVEIQRFAGTDRVKGRRAVISVSLGVSGSRSF